MFRISRLHELLKPIGQAQFKRVVTERAADKHCKGFRCWDQLVAMVYGQLAGARGLRQLVAGFNSQPMHHYHLRTDAVRRSTLSDANAARDPEVFGQIARSLMDQAKRSMRREVKDLLYALDSTSLTLKGHGFDTWTAANRTRNTQGMKAHVLLAAPQAVPCAVSLTAANVNDIEAALGMPLEAGALYVFDKGYCDYNWWAQIDQAKARFVTRFKRNAALTVEDMRTIASGAADTVLADEIVRFTHRHPRAGRKNTYTQPLRRITIARPDKDTPLVLATNDLTSDALIIAQHYRDRWQIELFFKWIKQHLSIKKFYGQSQNAVRIQIYTALISYLLLHLYRQAHGIKDSLWSVLGEVRATLFQRPSLEAELAMRRRAHRDALAACQPSLFQTG